MNNIITIVLPEELLKYLKNQKNWYYGNTCIDEQIADILNNHLCEYSNDYYTSCDEWKKQKLETYSPLISNIFK